MRSFRGRRITWYGWFAAASLTTLQRAVEHFSDGGNGLLTAERALAGEEPRPWRRSVALRVRRGLQRWLYARLEQCPPGYVETRMRRKLERWHLPGFPRVTAAGVIRRLHDLRRLVPPRVQVAVLSIFYNRWATARRFQRDAAGKCCLGCGGDDAVEHYLRCRIARQFAATHLGLNASGSEMWSLLLLADRPPHLPDNEKTLGLAAMLVYVLYRATNALRRLPPQGGGEVQRVMRQVLFEAVRGHARAQKLMIGSW